MPSAPAVVSDAIVLHVFDYRETSRILKIATREAGVRSVIARGARRSKHRFGAALDLFCSGEAHIQPHPTGDLHTLLSFEVTRPRTGLAGRWRRFVAASALTEITMRCAREEENAAMYDVLDRTLDQLAVALDEATSAIALRGAWSVVAALGFGPALDSCARCGAPVADSADAAFSHRAGGVLCARCRTEVGGARTLPASARAMLAAWLEGGEAIAIDDRETRAHQRLLREFLNEHLDSERPLRAYAVWERGDWSSA